jgi:hypothetical protein
MIDYGIILKTVRAPLVATHSGTDLLATDIVSTAFDPERRRSSSIAKSADIASR